MTALAELTHDVPSENSEVPMRDIISRYNTLAGLLDARPVNKFQNRTTALRRLAILEVEAKARFTINPDRKKRQKVFNYPPLEKLSALKPGTLRAEARDLLLKGATLGKVEELIAEWDVRNGKKPHRLEPRAYGLVRLLHSYVGYALREEGVGDNKIIYVMTPDAWKAWKATQA